MSYQKCIVVGNLGADAEMRYTPSGAAVSNFRVAVNERWNDRDGQAQERTTWFRVALWGKQAEAINQYLVKGKEVLVEGSVEASAYTAQDGTPKAGLELRARDVRLLGSREGGGAEPDAPQQTEPPRRTSGVRILKLNDDDDSIPF